jgi:hypothetical protein
MVFRERSGDDRIQAASGTFSIRSSLIYNEGVGEEAETKTDIAVILSGLNDERIGLLARTDVDDGEAVVGHTSKLTPAQARELGEALLAAAEAADGGHSDD